MQKDKLKQYSGLLIIGILLIVVYKVFEPSWFSVLLNACFPIIIGGVPVVFIVLLTNGIMPAIWTALFIFALQQFDGLILGPRILGDSVGISPFWIICSITIFGSLFGFLGMFLGVPLICVIRMFFNDFLEYRKNRIKD